MNHLLAKLTTKAVNLNPIGGAPDLTWQDVAFAIAKLSQEHSLFARAVYCEDNHDTQQFIDLMMKKTNTEFNVIRAALFEFVFKKRCKKCGGDKITGNSECKACFGSGLKPFSNRERAANIGKSLGYYNARSVQYDELIGHFNVLDRNVAKAIRKKLS